MCIGNLMEKLLGEVSSFTLAQRPSKERTHTTE